MKNCLLSIILTLVALPVFGVCPLSGACAAPSNSVLAPSTLKEKLMPDNLENIQKPSSFAPQYVEPFDNMKVNTGETAPSYTPTHIPIINQYNADCQFGLCLP